MHAHVLRAHAQPGECCASKAYFIGTCTGGLGGTAQPIGCRHSNCVRERGAELRQAGQLTDPDFSQWAEYSLSQNCFYFPETSACPDEVSSEASPENECIKARMTANWYDPTDTQQCLTFLPSFPRGCAASAPMSGSGVGETPNAAFAVGYGVGGNSTDSGAVDWLTDRALDMRRTLWTGSGVVVIGVV